MIWVHLITLFCELCVLCNAQVEGWTGFDRGWKRSPEGKKFWRFGERGLDRRRDQVISEQSQGGRHGASFGNGGQEAGDRGRRFLSLFTLVKFENNLCGGPTGENGICVSAAECSQRKGSASGTCANGYGVCCVVTVTCGQSTSDNNTYFVNTNHPSPTETSESCQLTLIKSHPDVCQFRLDFIQMSIRGPETTNHMCTYDQFIVSGANPIPPICGNNDGNHMYVNAGTGQSNPVTLTFVTSGSNYSRFWKIRVSQIPCSTIYRAEEGCLQYYTGVSGEIKSFNYDDNNGLQLSNQDYSICIRTENNFCGIQYMACSRPMQPGAMATPGSQSMATRISTFTLSGNTMTQQVPSMTGTACQADWLMIPCASNLGRLSTAPMTCVDRICGGAFNAENQNINSSTVISTIKPFRLVLHTDNVEAPSDIGNRGFCLNYIQQPCTSRIS
ncbi:uncharacterized protein LOC105699195 [Orussus abietinus]|uniref:uncharacterized protein LOC105699195 n=1 Tax=Orussus abietinus TaxID=222816 RepID=UPI0006265C19|nr:uncharacterized protein LOC105699195 [Orussus abietinus]